MSDLKRLPIKYVRDFIKKDYIYDNNCYICGSEIQLELHHLYSISEMWNIWLDKEKVDSSSLTIETIKELRRVFYDAHRDVLGSHNLFTLCKPHHVRLHSIYGLTYSNWRSEKVKEWLENQKTKFGE